MRQIVESGEYFKQAKNWYNEIYLLPIVYRSWVFVIFSILFFFSLVLVLNLYMLFPINQQLRYAITVENTSDYTADITAADFYGNDTYKSIAHVFLTSYVKIREGYDYDDLSDRLMFVKNTSTKVIFNQYNDLLSLDNPNSPLLKLQKYAKRSIFVKDIKFISDSEVVVRFNAKSNEDNGKILDDSVWEANISFLMDQIDLKVAENASFNFTVSDYKSKLIKDNNV